MAQKLQSVRGMNDLLPSQIARWHRVEAVLRAVGWAYGYQEIRTPMVEQAELFTQSIGDQTDIVQKEMYIFADRERQQLALRPEATASVVRACNQHGLLHNAQQRLWYLGPMFRRERPQQGRYRQFHQFGVEAFGWAEPDMDAEVLRLSARIWRRLQVRDVHLQINTLGSPQNQQAYRQALQDYFGKHRQQLDADSVRRLDTNPLRILDSKVADTMALVADAPDLRLFLDDEIRRRFERLCELLHQAELPFTVNPRLVRGLDYYTGTVFEWVTEQLGAQNAVCAGGRYDRLVENRGGHACPAVGFALGLERMVELLRAQEESDDNAANVTNSAPADIYVLSVTENKSVTTEATASVATVSEMLRDADADYKIIAHYGGGKLNKQMKRAAASGARFAVITNADAHAANPVQVKKLHAADAQQPMHTINLNALAAWLKDNFSFSK